MKKVIGICNLHDDPKLGVLTEKRPLGAVTFLGRYGCVDFVLSNFSNSRIDRVYVLVKNNIISMRNHIGSGSIWSNNTKTCSVSLLINEEGLSNPKFNSDINNMRANLPIDKMDFEYAVIAPSFMLASIDYRPLIEQHINSKKPFSVLYSVVANNGDEYKNCDSLIIENDLITNIKTNNIKQETFNLSLESVIINKEMLKKCLEYDSKDNIREVLKRMVKENKTEANAIRFDGYFVPMLDLQHYVNYSFNLLDSNTRSKLFLPDWPIYTTTHNTPPALYGKNADVKNSFVANGAIIKGKVRNSIISREVIIDEGASVHNCIIFTDSEIGKNVKIEYAVTDKNIKIADGKKVSGKPNKYIYIENGAKI